MVTGTVIMYMHDYIRTHKDSRTTFTLRNTPTPHNRLTSKKTKPNQDSAQLLVQVVGYLQNQAASEDSGRYSLFFL